MNGATPVILKLLFLNRVNSSLPLTREIVRDALGIQLGQELKTGSGHVLIALPYLQRTVDQCKPATQVCV